MNRLDLVNKFKNNDVQGILYLEYLEHCSLEQKDMFSFSQFMLAAQHKLNKIAKSYSEYIDYTIMEIRNKYQIMFVFNDRQQVIHIY